MKLSARTAIFDSYRWLFGLEAGFLALVWKPLVLAGTGFLLLVLLALAFGAPYLLVLVYPLILALGSAFAVAWHRRVLLDEKRPRPGLRPTARYAARVAIFVVGWTLLVVAALLGANFAGLGESLEIGAMAFVGMAGTWVGARLMTLLPAAALSVRQSLSDAWGATRGAGLRLFFGCWLALLPFVMLIKAIERGSERFAKGSLAPVIAAELAILVLAFVEVAIAAGYASSVFKQSGALGAAATAPSAEAGAG